MQDGFLCKPLDEQEGRSLHLIRLHYLPEVVLAYNSSLLMAGHAVSRQSLVKCMELANTVAASPSLLSTCVEARRMREIVSALAMSSQVLLRANETGNRKSTEKKVKGFDMWSVDWQEITNGGLDTVD